MPSGFEEFLDSIAPKPEPEAAESLPEEPADLAPPRFRRIRECKAPIIQSQGIDVEEAREMIANVGIEYLQTEFPTYALVVVGSPGLGKTTMGVRTAEWAAAQGRKVLYAGPRHDFFEDIKRICHSRSDWYEWLPRRKGNEEKGISGTCEYAEAINVWLARGYPGMEFCRQICGWDFVNGRCVYHLQRATRAPIIFGQHQHVTLGHPLPFSVVIGDELPLGAFMHRWVIPGKFIMPNGMDVTEPIAEVLSDMQSKAADGVRADGQNLVTLLGGATRVREACESFRLPLDALAEPPRLRSVYQVDDLPYFHLRDLLPLLAREAREAEAGREYPTRVAIDNGRLVLLLRRQVNPKLPAYLIWLDATANQHLYETMLGRPVQVVAPEVRMRGRVFQVYDRQNGKSSLFETAPDADGKPVVKTKAKLGQLQAQVKRIALRYPSQRVGLITYQALEDQFPEFAEQDKGHFYAERGTNRFEDLDALIVAGVPQPGLWDIEATAKMVFFNRMKPFVINGKLPWVVRPRLFAYVDEKGRGREYPTADFGADVDLNAILWQYREAELIQAAHRARPNLREVDVWLLENLPIDELPPTRLMEVRELFGAPAGVDAYRWPEVEMLARLFHQEGKELSTQDIGEHLGLKRYTTSRYLSKIAEAMQGMWEMVTVASGSGKGGRPRKALRPKGGACPYYIVGETSEGVLPTM